MKYIKIVAALSIVLAFGACQKQEIKRSIPPTPALLVKAESKKLAPYIPTLGTTASFQSVQIVPQVSGQIIKINFKQGEFVKEGDIIAEIDPRPYKAQVMQAEGALAQSKAQLRIDELEVERNKKLVKDNYVDKQTFDSYVARVEVDKGIVEANQAALDLAKINLEWCSIKAPCDGKMGFYNINSGNVVAAGSSVITTIEYVNKLYVDFVIPSQKLYDIQQYIKKAEGGKIKVLVSYIEDSQKSRKREALVDTVLNKMRYASGTAVLRGVMENSDHLFWPDQPVSVTIHDGVESETVLVPDICVQMGPSKNYVYLARPYKDGVFIMEQVPVEKGQLFDGNMRAVKGIKPGDLVALQVNQLRLQAGPFVYMATADGAIIGADGKPITTPEKMKEFMLNAANVADSLRVEMMQKAATKAAQAGKLSSEVAAATKAAQAQPAKQ